MLLTTAILGVCDHCADVSAGRRGNRLDAQARHAEPLAGSHPDRFRQIGLRAVGPGRVAARLRSRVTAAAGNPANRWRWVWRRVCNSCFSPCWCRCWPATDKMDGGARPAVCRRRRPTSSTSEYFVGGEAYASFPSGHADHRLALAFAVSAVWPQARLAMLVYAVTIALSRLVLLAHHPSDVVAGALVGVIGAMCGALLVRRAPAGFYHSWRRHHCAASGALAADTSKGLPAGRQPHKKRTPRSVTGRYTGSRRKASKHRSLTLVQSGTKPPSAAARLRPTQTTSTDLSSSDPTKWPFPSLFPCATRPAMWRR